MKRKQFAVFLATAVLLTGVTMIKTTARTRSAAAMVDAPLKFIGTLSAEQRTSAEFKSEVDDTPKTANQIRTQKVSGDKKPQEQFVYYNPVPNSELSTKPVILYKEMAHFTDEARSRGINGVVVLSMVITPEGKIAKQFRVVRGLPCGLTGTAIEAAGKMRFKPGMKDGQAVAVRTQVEFSFGIDAPVQKLTVPSLIDPPEAQYTELAKQNRIQGTVILNALFKKNGTIDHIKVIQELPDGLIESAIEALKKTRFEPATENRKPIDMTMTMQYYFKPDPLPGSTTGQSNSAKEGDSSGAAPPAGSKNDQAIDGSANDATTEVYQASSLTTKPVVLYKPAVKRPDNAGDVRGVVVLSVVVTAEGTVTGIRVVRGLPDGFTEKAVEAARSMRYKPGTKDGQPVATRVMVEFVFDW